MDFLSSSPLGTSDDSSCDDSTGPTTPDSSPLFGAARVEELVGTPIAHLLEPGVAILPAEKTHVRIPGGSRELSGSRPVRHIAVVGAGYVGRSTLIPLIVCLEFGLQYTYEVTRASGWNRNDRIIQLLRDN
jgi:UDPglucose 6-dehydrogenase